MASSGLRKRGAGGAGAVGLEADGDRSDSPARPAADSSKNGGAAGESGSYTTTSGNGHKIAFDPRDISESAERNKQPKLTIMEEVLLLGLKDKQVSHLLYYILR